MTSIRNLFYGIAAVGCLTVAAGCWNPFRARSASVQPPFAQQSNQDGATFESLQPIPRTQVTGATTPQVSLTKNEQLGSSAGAFPAASSGPVSSVLKSLGSGTAEAAISTAGKALEVAGNVFQGPASIFTSNNLAGLHVPGLFLIALAFAARLIFGSWRDAFMCSALGLAPTTLAVLFTEYSRSVIILPVGAVAIGGFWLWKKVSIWRAQAGAFKTAAKAIEAADAKEVKQLIASGATGDAKEIDKALAPIASDLDIMSAYAKASSVLKPKKGK